MSISSVALSASASPAARLTAVVVFPTPPFWLRIAIVLVTYAPCPISQRCFTWNIRSPQIHHKDTNGQTEIGIGAPLRTKAPACKLDPRLPCFVSSCLCGQTLL